MQIRVKLAIIAVLVLALTIPLFLITSKIYERDSYRNLAREDIARSWTGEQKVLGPILVVPYTRVVTKREFDDKLKKYVQRRIEVDEELLVLPEMLNAEFHLTTEVRYRGIYEVPVYSGTAKLSGTFSTAQAAELRQRPGTKNVGQPYLSLVLDDVRGIARTPDLKIGTETVAFKPGSKFRFRSSGIHAPIDIGYSDTDQPVPFSVSMHMRGTSSFRFAPVGDSNSVEIVSNWPHPSFEGRYLPSTRDIADDGFTANWQISTFSTNMKEQALQCSAGNCLSLIHI